VSDDVTVDPRPSAAADDFQSVLAAVTGRVVDLRAAADPPGGFLKLGDPGADPWWSFSAFGTDLFSVELNTAALDAWATAIDTVEDLDHELFAGTCGWMNVTQLRTAAARARAEQSSPEVADALDDAAEALSAFGQQMAHIYWESNKVLLNAVAIGANGISQNMQAYLRRAGLTTDSPGYQALAADPVAAVEQARLMIGCYSSTVIGDLPNGIAPISGDLGQPAVWAAANAAITRLISVELDKMDAVARTVAADLQAAYDSVSARLNAVGATFPVRPMPPGQSAPTREHRHNPADGSLDGANLTVSPGVTATDRRRA